MRQLLYAKEALATKYIMYFSSNLCPPPPLFLEALVCPPEIFPKPPPPLSIVECIGHACLCCLWLICLCVCRVRKQIVNVPSFIVRLDSQKHIDLALTSPFGGGKAGRVKRKNMRKAQSGGAGGSGGEEEEDDWTRIVMWSLNVYNAQLFSPLILYQQYTLWADGWLIEWVTSITSVCAFWHWRAVLSMVVLGHHSWLIAMQGYSKYFSCFSSISVYYFNKTLNSKNAFCIKFT